MDKDRQIRFLYPPFILMFSLMIGLYFDPNQSLLDILNRIGLTDKPFEVIIGGGVAILVLGFIIGTITVNLLRLIFLPWKNRHYEVVIKNETCEKIKTMIMSDDKDYKEWHRFYLAITFDHEIISKGVHEWIIRRWNSFNISMNSVVALFLSIIPAISLEITLSWKWMLVVFILGALLLLNGIISWRETMRMLDFQSDCKIQFNKDIGQNSK